MDNSMSMAKGEINYEWNYALMRKPPVKVNQPNCMKIVKLQ